VDRTLQAAEMKSLKRRDLKADGWHFGSAREFLEMTEEEETVVEIKLGLAGTVKAERIRRKMTQSQLGRLLGSSQSRVAKMEAADSSVSIDLLVRTLLRLGVSKKRVASRMAAPAQRRGPALRTGGSGVAG
jgi:predicted XRE-type DNA-binding protein